MISMVHRTITTHYGQFWEILSQNWGMKFCSYDFIFIRFLNILASKAQKTMKYVPSFEFIEIETKLHSQGLDFKLEFLGQESSKLTKMKQIEFKTS